GSVLLRSRAGGARLHDTHRRRRQLRGAVRRRHPRCAAPDRPGERTRDVSQRRRRGGQPAGGAADPPPPPAARARGRAGSGDRREPRDAARDNAPLQVRTLDRVVSLLDYEDFARAYAGIAKALATWSWDGQRRGVFLTVAGPEGDPVADEVLARLEFAIRRA